LLRSGLATFCPLKFDLWDGKFGISFIGDLWTWWFEGLNSSNISSNLGGSNG